MLPAARSLLPWGLSLSTISSPDVNAEHWGVLMGDFGVTGRCIHPNLDGEGIQGPLTLCSFQECVLTVPSVPRAGWIVLVSEDVP